MSSFISTQAITSSMRQSILQMQSELAASQTEVATGNYADIGLSLGATTGEAVSLQAQTSMLQTLTNTNQTVATRLSATSDNFKQPADLGTKSPQLSPRRLWFQLERKHDPGIRAKRSPGPDHQFELLPQRRLHFCRDEYRHPANH